MLLYVVLVLAVVALLALLVLRRPGAPDYSASPLLDSYDYVVVGGGTSGCAVAARLAEDPQAKVLLLEAGEQERDMRLKVPLAAFELQNTAFDWAFRTEVQEGQGGRKSNWPRGKVLGGSSNLNWMLAVRGDPADYDYWASQLGCEGWSYKELLPYFKKLEDAEAGEGEQPFDSKYRGRGGPVPVRPAAEPIEATKLFLNACEEVGLKRNPDYNGESTEGAALAQLTVKNGERHSAARSYLSNPPANLTIRTCAHVTRVITSGSSANGDLRATGVHFWCSKGKKNVTVHAKREVIMCAGTVQSPHILMLSGLGPRKNLESVGVECIADIPGMGQNLQDHLFMFQLFEVTKPIGYDMEELKAKKHLIRWLLTRKGPLASQCLEALAFVRTRPELVSPDLQLHLVPLGAAAEKGRHSKTRADLGLDPIVPFDLPKHIIIAPTLLRPKSRGFIELASSDPMIAPRVQPNYLSEEEDVQVLLEGMKLARRIFSAKAWGGSIAGEVPNREVDAEFGTDEYDRAMVTQNSVTVYHPTGTCSMGDLQKNPNAVCDARGRVRGVAGLRVADCSIMPEVPSANTQIPAYVVGERISDFIKEDNK